MDGRQQQVTEGVVNIMDTFVGNISWLPGLGGEEMRMRIFTITPEMAVQLLNLNTKNARNLNRQRVIDLANVIRAGGWRLTHQAVAISPRCVLLDGQHRLSAIEMARVPVPMTVAWNVPEESVSCIDIGKARTNRQVCSDLNPRAIDALAFLLELHGVRYVQPHHLRIVHNDIVGVAINDLLAICGRCARARSSAGVKCAAMLRYLSNPEYVGQQWHALLSLDYNAMSPSIQVLTRQFANESRKVDRNDRAARAWVAFDHRRSSISKIQINDIPGILNEMRQAYTLPQELKAN